jgi:tetratricopeptide (TPR) repeat protein
MSLETKLKEAIRLHQLGKVAVAKKRYQQILQVEPNNFDALHMFGVAALSEGNGSLAVDYIHRAISIFSKSPIAYFNLGNAYSSISKILDAEAAYQKAIFIDKNYVDAYLNLGSTLNVAAKFEDSIKILNQALKLRSNCPKINYQLGIAYALSNQTENAEQYFKSSLTIKPNFADAHQHLGNLLANQKKYNEAIYHLSQTLHEQPNNWEALQSLGGAFAEMGKFEESESCFSSALKINNKSESVKINQASLFRLKGDAKTALHICQQILDKTPSNYTALNLAAQVSLEQGDLKSAKTYFLKNYLSNVDHKWKQESGAFAAVSSYLMGDKREAQEILNNLSSSLMSIGASHLTDVVAIAYHGLLSKLMSIHSSKNGEFEQEIYVVAESHGLSHHGNRVKLDADKYKCSTLWVPGCKQWHLAKPYPNNYKVALETQLGKLPKGSKVLAVFGEIDCRLTSGIIPFQKKSPLLSVEQIVDQTVIGYLDFLTNINNACNHHLIISGIPAHNIDTSSVSNADLQLLIKVIQLMNARMREECQKRNFYFLDVYAMTNGVNGVSDGVHHIDAHHLTPVACELAFENHLAT